MTSRTASCCCGALSVECRAEPVRISVCHCLECQKRTGSVYGAQARFESDCVVVRGVSTRFDRAGDSGNTAQFHFCARCGSTVYWINQGMENFVMVAMGAFADPEFPAPTVTVYEDRQHAWARVSHDVERYD